MVRSTIIFVAIMQCIVGASSRAETTGHTWNNGGGLGEIAFADVWKNLDHLFAPCLTSESYCGLSEAQIEALKEKLQYRAPHVPKLASSHFYERDGKPLSRSKLIAFSLGYIFGCEAFLHGIHFVKLADQTLGIGYFRQFAGGPNVILLGSQQLLASGLDLTKLVAAKLRTSEVSVTSVRALFIDGVLDVSGVVQMGTGAGINFQVRINHGQPEVMVFP